MAPILSRHLYESLLISSIGLFFHINSWSLLKLPFPWRQQFEKFQILDEDDCIPSTLPNKASALFLVSVLGYISMLRPHYPKTLAVWKRFMLLIAEILIIVYFGEVILLKLWQPIFRSISMTCHRFADHLESHNKSGEVKWFYFVIRYEAINYLRFLLAVFMFLYTLDLSGWLHIFSRYMCRVFGHHCFCNCDEFRCIRCHCPVHQVIERQMQLSIICCRMKQAENLGNASGNPANTNHLQPSED